MVKKHLAQEVTIFILISILFFTPLYKSYEGDGNQGAWPMYMHDFSHTGKSAYSGPRKNTHILWSIDLTSHRTWFTSPIVDSKGDIWIGGEYKVYYVSSEGKIIGNISLETSIESLSFGFGDDTIYVNTWEVTPPMGSTFKKYLFSIDRNNMKIRWKFEYNGSLAPPLVGPDETVYVVEYNGSIYALSYDGKCKWKYDIEGFSSAVMGLNDTIYVGGYNSKKLYAFSKDGTLKWNISIGSIYSSPSVDNDGTIYVSAGDSFYAIYPDGEVKWKIPNLYLSTVAIGKNAVYGVDVEYIYAISKTGNVLWKYKPEGYTPGLYDAPPVLDKDETIYLTDEAGYIYALKSNGELLWKYKVSNESITTSAIIGGNGIIYLATNDGKLYALEGDVANLEDNERNDILSNTPWDYIIICLGGVVSVAVIYYFKVVRKR